MRNGEDILTEDVKAAEQAVGYTFKDKELMKSCFTHRSWSNKNGGADNERLEFLGDAVLELIVTEELYRNSRSREGTLTEIRQQFVSQSALEAASERAGLMRFLRYSGGENNVGGKTASNLFEAVLGGIYLDGGMTEARKFMERYLEFQETENYKSLLQEYVQERTKKTPNYTLAEKEGGYTCTVTALGVEGSGEGSSKKAAETAAARALYRKLTEGKR